jgi:thiol-disulfide isomerase/thioredoxin
VTAATRWALVLGVLVLAAVVALLPRDDPQAPSPAALPASAAPDLAAPDLAAARLKAALAPCPAPGAGRVETLAGVSASCLGDGRPVDLGAALAGRTTVVNVWATWCQPCRTELPVLAAYAAGPGAASVLGVQVASSPADGLALLTELGVHLPTVHDGDGPSGPVRAALKVAPVLPASYLVTPDGRVRFLGDPRVFDSPDQVRAAVEGAA